MKLDQMQEQQTDAQFGEYTIKDRAIARIGSHALTKQSAFAGPSSTTVDTQTFRYLSWPDTVKPAYRQGRVEKTGVKSTEILFRSRHPHSACKCWGKIGRRGRPSVL